MGDTNVRMDLMLGSSNGKIGVAEVEFGNGILDIPRNILDSLAVMSNRYGHDLQDIHPVSICESLPNKRSEYWQVVKDIRVVLDIKVATLSFGALMIALWNHKSLPFDLLENFYIDADDMNLRPRLESLLGRDLAIANGGYPGLLSNQK